jgi:hypothetical protein
MGTLSFWQLQFPESTSRWCHRQALWWLSEGTRLGSSSFQDGEGDRKNTKCKKVGVFHFSKGSQKIMEQTPTIIHSKSIRELTRLHLGGFQQHQPFPSLSPFILGSGRVQNLPCLAISLTSSILTGFLVL